MLCHFCIGDRPRGTDTTLHLSVLGLVGHFTPGPKCVCEASGGPTVTGNAESQRGPGTRLCLAEAESQRVSQGAATVADYGACVTDLSHLLPRRLFCPRVMQSGWGGGIGFMYQKH
jgi:hypothetical protein